MYSRRRTVGRFALLPLSVSLLLIGACKDKGGRPPVGATPTPTPSCAQGQRLFTAVNNHTQPLRVGVTSGSIACRTDADCPSSIPNPAAGVCQGANPQAGVQGTCNCNNGCGSIGQCNQSNNFCFWNPPEIGDLDLQPGESTTVCFPAPPPGSSVQWSGNMYAQTGCDANGQNCQTGGCNNQPGQLCPTGVGANPPATLAEFTLSNQTSTAPQPSPTPTPVPPDFYDISIINGVNVGMSMAPVPGTFQPDASNDYNCAAAGGLTQPGGLSPCTWKFTPTVGGTDYKTLLRDVAPQSFTGQTCPDGSQPNSLGYCECTRDTDCAQTGGQVCGLALNASATQKYTQVCGAQVGWWTADQICGSLPPGTSPLPTPLRPLKCFDTVTNSDGSTSTYTNFYLCTKPPGATDPEQSQSCYGNPAAADCCGCPTYDAADSAPWPSVLSPNFEGPKGGCFNNNPNWVTISRPWLVFLKQACPTAYSFPFDDASSTFTCVGAGSTVAPSYTVTFFPTQ